MQDNDIVALYLQRNEKAIFHTQKKYGTFLRGFAKGFLGNAQDAQETENDTYLRAWNAIPPDTPERLRPYLAKIARRLCIDMIRKNTAVKRGGGTYIESLDELKDCATDGSSPADAAETNALKSAINSFLETLDERQRNIFVQRYFYAYPISKIADHHKITENNVKVILHRLRGTLKNYLIQEGF